MLLVAPAAAGHCLAAAATAMGVSVGVYVWRRSREVAAVRRLCLTAMGNIEVILVARQRRRRSRRRKSANVQLGLLGRHVGVFHSQADTEGVGSGRDGAAWGVGG